VVNMPTYTQFRLCKESWGEPYGLGEYKSVSSEASIILSALSPSDVPVGNLSAIDSSKSFYIKSAIPRSQSLTPNTISSAVHSRP
jgi:hypothetical protein